MSGKMRQAVIHLTTNTGDSVRSLRVREGGSELSRYWFVPNLGVTNNPHRRGAGQRDVVHEFSSVDHLPWLARLYGPFECVEVLVSDGESLSKRLMERLLYSVVANGNLIIRALSASARGEIYGLGSCISSEWCQAVAEKRIDLEICSLVSGVKISGDSLSISKGVDHFAALKRSEVARFTAHRRDYLRTTVIEELAPGKLAASQFRENDRHYTFPDFSNPSTGENLYSRLYEGEVIIEEYGRVRTDSSLLPDTFVYSSSGAEGIRMAKERGYATVRASHDSPERIESPVFALNTANPGHFGHWYTDGLSRLWAWDEAKARVPDLKVLIQTKYPGERQPNFELAFTRAWGIDDRDVVVAAPAAKVDMLISADPLWSGNNTLYVNPAIVDTWDRLLPGLVSPNELCVGSRTERAECRDKIFISRGESTSTRGCQNQDDVEQFFRDQGYSIIYPELLSLPQQINLFRNAKHICGFGGSAMYNLVFAVNAERVGVLTHEGYRGRFEALICSARGIDCQYFWSSPNVEPTGKFPWRQVVHTSAWSFDFDRNSAGLNEFLG